MTDKILLVFGERSASRLYLLLSLAALNLVAGMYRRNIMSVFSESSHIAVHEFLEYIKLERNLSEHTVRNYGVDLSQFYDYLVAGGNGELFPYKVKYTSIRGFMAQLNENGISKQTIARKTAALRSFYKFQLKRGRMQTNPAQNIRTPKLEKKLPVFLSVEDVEKLLSAPEDQTFIGLRDKAILELLYSAGLRTFELVGLNHEDIDLVRQTIRSKGKGMKERINPIGKYATDALHTYIQAKYQHPDYIKFDQSAVFVNFRGSRLTTRSIRRMLGSYVAQAGLSCEVTPHTLRHSFATHLLQRGADLRIVQELLGHENISSTQIYTHITGEEMKALYDQAHPRDNTDNGVEARTA